MDGGRQIALTGISRRRGLLVAGVDRDEFPWGLCADTVAARLEPGRTLHARLRNSDPANHRCRGRDACASFSDQLPTAPKHRARVGALRSPGGYRTTRRTYADRRAHTAKAQKCMLSKNFALRAGTALHSCIQDGLVEPKSHNPKVSYLEAISVATR